MALIEYPAIEQRSDEWYDQRRGLVTASVVGSLLSIGTRTAIDFDCPNCLAFAGEPCCSKRTGEPIKTLHTERAAVAKRDKTLIIEPASNDTSRDLTALLVAERISGITEETTTTNDMWRGIECEPLARDKYSECFAPVRQTGFLVRDDWGFKLGFSPDGLVGDDGAIEIKAPRAKNHVKTVLSDGVPMEYMPQLQAGLLVSGREWIDFVSFSAGMHMWRKRVHRQPKWFEAIIAAVRLFEDNAAEMMRLYADATDGLPMTERRTEEEMVI